MKLIIFRIKMFKQKIILIVIWGFFQIPYTFFGLRNFLDLHIFIDFSLEKFWLILLHKHISLLLLLYSHWLCWLKESSSLLVILYNRWRCRSKKLSLRLLKSKWWCISHRGILLLVCKKSLILLGCVRWIKPKWSAWLCVLILAELALSIHKHLNFINSFTH